MENGSEIFTFLNILTKKLYNYVYKSDFNYSLK